MRDTLNNCRWLSSGEYQRFGKYYDLINYKTVTNFLLTELFFNVHFLLLLIFSLISFHLTQKKKSTRSVNNEII